MLAARKRSRISYSTIPAEGKWFKSKVGFSRLRKDRRSRAAYFHLDYPAVIKNHSRRHASGRRDALFERPAVAAPHWCRLDSVNTTCRDLRVLCAVSRFDAILIQEQAGGLT